MGGAPPRAANHSYAESCRHKRTLSVPAAGATLAKAAGSSCKCRVVRGSCVNARLDRLHRRVARVVLAEAVRHGGLREQAVELLPRHLAVAVGVCLAQHAPRLHQEGLTSLGFNIAHSQRPLQIHVSQTRALLCTQAGTVPRGACSRDGECRHGGPSAATLLENQPPGNSLLSSAAGT